MVDPILAGVVAVQIHQKTRPNGEFNPTFQGKAFVSGRRAPRSMGCGEERAARATVRKLLGRLREQSFAKGPVEDFRQVPVGSAPVRRSGSPEAGYSLSRSLGTATLATIAYPAHRALMADGTSTWGLCGTNRATVCSGRWGRGADTSAQQAVYGRHNGGGDVGYADGHVQWSPIPVGPVGPAACNRMWQNGG